MKYSIKGETLPVVICNLDANEKMITERGAMSWMSPNMHMETQGRGGIGKMFGRLFSGESMFLNEYTAVGGQGMIAFASSFPGSIIPFELDGNKDIIVQKSGFLASTSGVELSVYFQKRISGGFFGGEGFIMQRLSGKGTVFVEIDGSVIKYTLQPGQKIITDTGYLAAMDSTCTMDIVKVPGVKNILFGGEGLFNTEITGPGDVYLQTMPISQVAGTIYPYLPQAPSTN